MKLVYIILERHNNKMTAFASRRRAVLRIMILVPNINEHEVMDGEYTGFDGALELRTLQVVDELQ